MFVPAARAAAVLAALPPGIRSQPDDRTALARDGHARLWWDDTPVDVFLNYAPIHERAARHRRTVPFEGEEIPVLGPVELAVFKAMCDRTKDWADIEAMLSAGALDAEAARAELVSMVGVRDPRVARLERLA